MKIIVTSDVHGDKDGLINIEKANLDAEFYLDCGDSELNEFQLGSFLTVKGNCDYENYPLYRVIKVNDDLNIFITHSHRYNHERMKALAKELNCKIVLYGHTHKKKLEEEEGIYFINPGSIKRPRGGNPKTYLEINYDEIKKTFTFEFIKINL